MSSFVRGFGKQSLQTGGPLGSVEQNKSCARVCCVVCELFADLSDLRSFRPSPVWTLDISPQDVSPLVLGF